MKKLKISRKEAVKLESQSSRYAVYGLMEKKVRFMDGSRKVIGVVQKVLRSVFDDTVTITIKDKEYAFDEPQLMYRDGDDVVFVYGDLTAAEMDDEELFNEARGSGFSGETVHDVLKRTEKGGVMEHRFEILEKPSEEPKAAKKQAKKKAKKKGKK